MSTLRICLCIIHHSTMSIIVLLIEVIKSGQTNLYDAVNFLYARTNMQRVSSQNLRRQSITVASRSAARVSIYHD